MQSRDQSLAVLQITHYIDDMVVKSSARHEGAHRRV